MSLSGENEKVHEDKFHDASNGLEDSGEDEFSDATDQLPDDGVDGDDLRVVRDDGEESDYSDEEDFKREEEANLTDDQLLRRKEESKTLKEDGNRRFKDQDYSGAITYYSLALRLCPFQCLPERSILFSNRATARSHILPSSAKLLEKIVHDCTKSLEADGNYMKPLLRRAQTYRELGSEKLEESLVDYKKIVESDPANREAKVAVVELGNEITERNEKLKTEMIDKLKDLGNLVLKPFGLSTSNFQLKQNSDTGGYSVNFKQN